MPAKQPSKTTELARDAVAGTGDNIDQAKKQ